MPEVWTFSGVLLMPRPQQSHMTPLSWMVEEAIDFIRCHEPEEGYFVGFSGGKDSIVTLELVLMAGVKHQAFMSYTGIDPPELVKFVRTHYSDIKLLYPAYSFWQGIQKKTPPLRVSRWCCDVLKKNPSKKIKLHNRIMGLRAEESAKRAARPRVEWYNSVRQWIYKPIFYWLEWHVWEFIESHGLAYPSLYDEGFDRIGCVVCPFLSNRKLKQNMELWPKYYRTFEHAVKKWFTPEVLEKSPMLQRFNIRTAEQYLEFWYGRQKEAFQDKNVCCRVVSPFEEDE